MADIGGVAQYTHQFLHLVRKSNSYNNYYIALGWSSVSSRVVVDPFSEPVGPTVTMPDSSLQIFSLFFTRSVIDHLVRETNRYAEQCLADTDKEWHTNCDEMRAYLGFNILMGIVHEPEIRDYWSQSDLLHYSPIAGRISRRRFEEISTS